MPRIGPIQNSTSRSPVNCSKLYIAGYVVLVFVIVALAIGMLMYLDKHPLPVDTKIAPFQFG
uniref:Uncharacterized protein n=1 Tax=Caenorhabditis elegans TaxID=6239 RepID=Q965P4_CAEEL|eukprot:NP_497435.1 Uncharacterized protein CELE_Y22D7AL.13 [Caenorhabditis elegans]